MSVTIESELTTNFADYMPSGELCQDTKLVWPNLSEMEFRTFARIQKVIWDQLLASKAHIIQK